MASYPTTVKTFSVKKDFVDTVYAENVNTLQDEVNAVEATLGTNIQTPVLWGSVSEASFTTPSSAWSSVKDRLDNLENGAYLGVSLRVKTAGGSTISNSGTDFGLKFQPASGATGDAAVFYSVGGVKTTWVDKDGVLQTSQGAVADLGIVSSMLLGGM